MTEALKTARKLMDQSWFWYVVLGIPVSLVAFAVFYRIYSDSQELARLHSEKEKAEERAKNLALQAQVEALEEKKVALTQEAAQNTVKAQSIETEIVKLKESYEAESADIDSLSTWSEFWDHLGRTDGKPPQTDPDPGQPGEAVGGVQPRRRQGPPEGRP